MLWWCRSPAGINSSGCNGLNRVIHHVTNESTSLSGGVALRRRSAASLPRRIPRRVFPFARLSIIFRADAKSFFILALRHRGRAVDRRLAQSGGKCAGLEHEPEPRHGGYPLRAGAPAAG